jgi:hypothetical protein
MGTGRGPKTSCQLLCATEMQQGNRYSQGHSSHAYMRTRTKCTLGNPTDSAQTWFIWLSTTTLHHLLRR